MASPHTIILKDIASRILNVMRSFLHRASNISNPGRGQHTCTYTNLVHCSPSITVHIAHSNHIPEVHVPGKY